MKFYDRDQEIDKLLKLHNQAASNAQMTYVTGRRRIGKTYLLVKAYEKQTVLYFFVARKSEEMLCQDFENEIAQQLKIPLLGKVTQFGKLFDYLMQLSKEHQFTLIIDEFQEFFNINPSIYSDIQHYWDINKDDSHLNLLLCGSVYTMMHKIFENNKEPLFGRATAMMTVKPFSISVLKQILKECHPQYSSEDLLALYLFTGGVAKYVQLLMDNKAFTIKKMVQYILQEDSPFLNEGKYLLIEEFGKEYALYFSILSCIANGENTRSKIESIIQHEIGGHLTKLERDYNLISKAVPILSKTELKNMRYQISDNFLVFWFRFIYKYGYLIEIGRYDALRDVVLRDYSTFSGLILERFFRQQMIEQQLYTRIGNYWTRKGDNEIDIVGLNDLNKTILFAEVKRNKKHIRMSQLEEKAGFFMSQYPQLKDYQVEYKGLSLEDM